MSYMVPRDHIAITSGDKSTTRREVSLVGRSFTLGIDVTHRDSCDTYRRIGLDLVRLPARLARLGGERDLNSVAP